MQQLGPKNLSAFMREGVFYAPATRHYAAKHHGRENLTVNCDYCGARSLAACIGLGDQDLCLRCAQSAAEDLKVSAKASSADPAFLQSLVGLTVAEAQARVEDVGLTLRAVPPGTVVTMEYRSNRVNATTDADCTVIVAVNGRG
jgi:hypothetical protein